MAHCPHFLTRQKRTARSYYYPRYDPSDKMYLNKRGIPSPFVPETDVFLPPATNQQKAYTWWPVAVMELKPRAMSHRDVQDYKYAICVYQAMLEIPVAWGIKISQVLNLPLMKDCCTRPLSILTGCRFVTFTFFFISLLPLFSSQS